MGPEPEGSGRRGVRDARGVGLPASMGPDPEGSGREARGARGGVLRHASMGPDPEGSGRAYGLDYERAWAKWLQWGRIPKDPEGISTGDGGTVGAMWLQWGRIPKDPEGRPLVAVHVQRVRASMGPDPEGSGRAIVFAPAPYARARLQWGRIPKDPEGWPARPSSAPRCCFNGAGSRRIRKASNRGTTGTGRVSFNGAGSRRIRKVAARRRGQGQGFRASMGPDPEGSGRRTRRASGAPGSRCFNGAGSRRIRKEGSLHTPRMSALVVLQWGRIPKDPEGQRTVHGLDREGLASMGPDPEGSGRRAAATSRKYVA